jgi:hypothetical protein
LMREWREEAGADRALARKAAPRTRRLAVERALSAAKKAGVMVVAVTVDGVTLHLGDPVKAPAAQPEVDLDGPPPRALFRTRVRPKMKVVL